MLTPALENKACSQRLKNLPINASSTSARMAAIIIPIMRMGFIVSPVDVMNF